MNHYHDTGSGPLPIEAVRHLNSEFGSGRFAAALKGREHTTMIRLFATLEAQYRRIAYLEDGKVIERPKQLELGA